MFHFRKTTKYCSNCGNQGHSYRDCPQPVISYGTLLFRVKEKSWVQEQILASSPQTMTGFENEEIEVLMIRRRDTLGFVDLLRGKYSIHDIDYIRKQIAGMTLIEREKIVDLDFDELWQQMWGGDANDVQYKKEKENSRNKLLTLREGITLELSGEKVSLAELVIESRLLWSEPEWGFPKGRRDGSESDVECAMREMKEETGLNSSDVVFIHNMDTLRESFYGSNGVHYCHKYFIVYVPDGSHVIYNPENPHMLREIGAIEWVSLTDAFERIRYENIEKRAIVRDFAYIVENCCPLVYPF